MPRPSGRRRTGAGHPSRGEACGHGAAVCTACPDRRGLGAALLPIAACVTTDSTRDSAELQGCWHRSVDNRPAGYIDLDQTICLEGNGKASFGFVEDKDGVEYAMRYRLVGNGIYIYDEPASAWERLKGQFCKASVIPNRSLTLSGYGFANTYLAPCKKGHYGTDKVYACDVFKDQEAAAER